MQARGAFWASKKGKEDSIQFVGGILWLFLFALLVFSSSSPYHKTQNSTRELNNFLLYFLIKRSTLFTSLGVHEKVLQTSLQLLHESEEMRVFARRNMWMGGEWDEAKLEIFLNDHGTHHTGALKNENIGIDLDSSFFIFLYFTFLVLFACFSFFHFTKD